METREGLNDLQASIRNDIIKYYQEGRQQKFKIFFTVEIGKENEENKKARGTYSFYSFVNFTDPGEYLCVTD